MTGIFFPGNKILISGMVGCLVVVGGMFFTSYSSWKHSELKKAEKEKILISENLEEENQMEIDGITERLNLE